MDRPREPQLDQRMLAVRMSATTRLPRSPCVLMSRMEPTNWYEQALAKRTVALCREKGWDTLLTCKACGHGGGCGAVIEVGDLDRFPDQLTMLQLAERASFPCGHRGAWVDHRQSRGSIQRPYGGEIFESPWRSGR
jgi:hypothetical protein